MIEILGAIGGVAQVTKILFDYYATHQSNKAVLDILEGFSKNLELSVGRLRAREEMLTGRANPALESITRDFQNAQLWLTSNEKNLKSKWTVLQAAEKLKDLDDRLTKAFASKIAIAIFSSLQDSRAATTKIQATLDGMHGSLEQVVRDASTQSVRQAVEALKEEAYWARGGDAGTSNGFRNGEAEKIISQLVDQLSAQEALKEDASLDLHGSARRTLSDGAFSHRLSTTASEVVSDSSSSSRTLYEHPGANYASSSGRSAVTAKRPPGVPPGMVLVSMNDPLSRKVMIDPVLASDGRIYDRWTLISESRFNPLKLGEPLVIVGPVLQLQQAIFVASPERRQECESRRLAYREETIQLYADRHDATGLLDLVERLSHILLWDSESVSLHVRRGLVRYRLRYLAEALQDLEKAVQLSTMDEEQLPGKYEPSTEALRYRALVRDELHDTDGAQRDVEKVLASSPTDILCRSLRATFRANRADLKGAQDDLEAINTSIHQDTAYKSDLGESDIDLDFLARGWAYSSISNFGSSAGDFDYALSLQGEYFDTYTLGSRGLARVRSGQQALGMEDLNGAVDEVSRFSMAASAAGKLSDVSLLKSSGDVIPATISGLPVHAFACLFLRAMAHYANHEYLDALSDFESALGVRPKAVIDTGEFRAALGAIRALTGDLIGAAADFDSAVALDPKGRWHYNAARESFGI